MPYTGTAGELLGQIMGKDTVPDGVLNRWNKNFDAFSAVRRASFYTELITRLSALTTGWQSFERLVERFAEVRQGDGSQTYLLTEVNPTPGELYSPEYDSEAAVQFLFGNHKPDTRQSAIAQVRNWMKAITIKDYEIAAASYPGMIDLASRYVDSLQDSDRLSEWNIGMGLLFDAVRRGIGTEITVPAPTDGDTAREYSAAIGAIADFINNPSAEYNPGRVTSVFPVEDLRVLVRSTLWQTIAKSQYSQAFQPEYMRGITDKQYVTIPDEHWPSDLADVSAVIVSKGTKSSMVFVDNGIDSAAVVNAPFTSVNQTLTHRSVFGINPYGVFVVIRNGAQVAVAGTAPVPAAVELEVLLNGSPVTELIRGYYYKLAVKVTDEYGFLAGRADVEVDGAESPTGSTFVQVDDLDFYVGLDEPATSLTLKATAALDNAITDSLTLPVAGTRMPVIPPFESVEPDVDNDGNIYVKLTPSMLATFSGNTATPPSPVDDRFTLTYAGTVAGDGYNNMAFTAPVTLTTAGDTITIIATAAAGYQLLGTSTRTLNFS